MKAIYDAIRKADLRKWRDEPMLFGALLNFERSNRGHRHQLNDSALIAAAQLRGTKSPELYSRGHTLRDTTRHLMLCLQDLARNQMPEDEDFQSIWKAPDPTGLLAHLCKRLLESHAHYRDSLADKLVLRDLSTLEGCWLALRDARRNFADLARGLPAAPNFSEASYREAVLADGQLRIERALRGLAPQARQLLADYWHRLRPLA